MDLLLALYRDGSVSEIRLRPDAKQAVGFSMGRLAVAFRGPGTETLEYEPGFSAGGEDIVMSVPDFELPESIWRCRKTLPNDVPAFTEQHLADSLPTALVAIDVGNDPRFYFQAIETRDIFREGHGLFFKDGSLELNPRPGLIVPHRIDAMHSAGALYFRSETMCRRFLDLETFFQEATDDEIKTVFNRRRFVVDDWDAVKAAANSVVRRKLHRVLASGRTFDPGSIREIARRSRIQQPKMRDGRIVVPSTGKELRNLVRILNDDFLESMFDEQQVYHTTSKRPVG